MRLPSWSGLVRRWSTTVVGMAIGIWAALLVVPGFVSADAGGPGIAAGSSGALGASATPGVALWFALTATAVATLAAGSLLVPVYRAWGRAAATAANRFTGDPLLDVPRRQFFAPVYRMWALGLVRLAIDIAGAVVVLPAALWLTVYLWQLAGAPVALPAGPAGLGTAVIAGVVTDSVRAAFQRATRWLTGPGRLGPAARDLAEYGMVLIGLWLAGWLVDGVWLTGDSGALTLVTSLALAAVFTRVEVWVSVRGLTLLLLATITGLKLWLVSWFSHWCEVTLWIEGFGAFMLATVILTALTLPSRLAAARLRSGVTVGIGP